MCDFLKFNYFLLRLYINFGFRCLIILFFAGCNFDSEEEEMNYNTVELVVETNGSGTVTISNSSYDVGTEISIAAIPSVGYYFDRWEGFDDIIESQEYTFTLEKDLNLTAFFIEIPELTDEIEVFSPKKIDSNPVFVIENGGNKAYLVSKNGETLKSWNFDSRLGNDLELLDDGSLIGLFKPENVSFSFGGYGGILKKFDDNGNLLFEYELNTIKELLHHDFEVLPNGNILLMVWESFSVEEAIAMGYDSERTIYLEKIIELNPELQTIVWEWRSSDHLIQDFNPEASNFGIVSNSPQKIDLNYFEEENGDLMHANGIFYDSANDVIYLSVNFYGEVWVIPHKYDSETTRGNLGDLIYRFGNPSTYDSTEGTRLFYNNHHPTLVTLDSDTEGRFLIYMNGSKDEQSEIYEFILPSFNPDPQNWVSPEITWTFTDENLFFGKISGALRLPNGNTLICEGDYGYWEVTRSKEIVWKYNGGGETTFWRGYVFPNMSIE